MKESIVQAWVKEQMLKSFPDAYIFKVQSGQYSSRRGIPDWVMCVEGKFVGIEVKTESGSLTKLQQYEIDKISKAGGLGYVIYGKDEAMLELIVKDIKDDI